ncbi:MAG: PAS domain S-box protein [Deltaproteobacteria bacterium]|nr:PAS domain S-box protein [Deltaproteobacteria bacterium]
MTDKKQPEEALKESEAKYRIVADYTYDWEFWLAPDGHFLYCSPSCERITGYTAERFLNDKSLRSRLIHPDDRKRFEAHTKDIEHAQMIREEQWRFIRQDGSYRWVAHICQPVFDSAGRFLGVRGSNRDITEYKQVEDTVREAAREKTLILDSVSEIIAYHDTENNLIWANRAYLDVLGIPLSELRGKKCYKCWGLDRLCRNCPVTLAIRTGQPQEGELTPENQPHWPADQGSWSVRSAPVKDSTGKAIGAIEVAQDITVRKQSEERVRKENHKTTIANQILRLFMEESSDDLFDKALSVVLESTKSRHGVFGYIAEPGHLICPSLSKMLEACEVEDKCIHYPPEKWKGLWAKALREKRSFYINEAPPVPAGHVPIENNLATPVVFNDQVIGLINQANKDGGYTDADRELIDEIAELIAPVLYAWIQRTLREQERERLLGEVQAERDRISALVASMQDEVWFADTQKRFTLANPAALRAFGLATDGTVEVEEFAASLEVLSPDGSPRPIAETPPLRALKGEVVINQEEIIRTPTSGELRYRQVSAAPVRDKAGQIIGSVSVVRDITEVKLAEKRLTEANLQLAEADRRKNEFLAMLSHELRNPLAPIANSLFILDRTPPEGEQATRAKQVIGRQVEQLSNLVNDLLDVTRITRDKVQLQKERLELNEIVRRAVADHRTLFERARIRLELVPSPRPVPVFVDRTRISQIVGNLLQNAAKFTTKGGSTRVSVAMEANEAIIRVRDDGVGIDGATLCGLFQPFMQVDKTLDRSKGGLGLGLALVKGLIELHGGSVSAHSEGLGKGTEFFVRLPLDTGAALETKAAAVQHARVRRRVLIIDDNIDSADTLCEALALGKHEVVVAYNGPDGIAKAREFHPEIVLCDIGLPGMDGYAVARVFRADETLKGMHLIALSGYALAEDLKRATDAGFERHLAKPPSFEKLEQLLAEVPSGLIRNPFTPRASLPTQADRPQSALQPRENLGSGRRVLVIDDYADSAETLRYALELGGHSVYVAHDGSAGIALAREVNPEIVICDIGLPDMDGYAVARAMRSEQALQGMYLIALTGFARPEDVERAREAGFDDHAAKPLNLKAIRQLFANIPAEPA